MAEGFSSDHSRFEKALEGRARPLAFVDLDRFDRNARSLVERSARLPLRVASKSVRSVALLRRALAVPGCQGLVCFSGWEAVHLAKAGFTDLVVAYPIIDAGEIRAVAAVAAQSRIVLMVDRPEHLALLQEYDLEIAFDLDLSTSIGPIHFGVRRSALRSVEDVIALVRDLERYPRLKLVGAMGYEAQIAGISDRSRLMRWLKRWSGPRVLERRGRMVDALRASGRTLRFVNGGGTGSLTFTRSDESVTELTAGSGLYQPALFDGYEEFNGEAAAGFALSVTRKPVAEIVTCFGGGYIASGAVGPEKLPLPWLPSGLRLLPHEGAGEVQTPLGGEAARWLKIGDTVFFRHAKAGELCERFNELHLISGDRLVDVVPTYRGEGVNFG